MDIKNDIKPISYVKAHAADVLKQVNETQRPIYITQNGEARGVLVDPLSYQNTQDALKLMKLISQSEKEIEAGEFSSQDKVFSKLKSKFG